MVVLSLASIIFECEAQPVVLVGVVGNVDWSSCLDSEDARVEAHGIVVDFGIVEDEIVVVFEPADDYSGVVWDH